MTHKDTQVGHIYLTVSNLDLFENDKLDEDKLVELIKEAVAF